MIHIMYIWVCLKIVYPFLPNGFADHYPKNKWLFHWEYTQHFQTNPYIYIVQLWPPYLGPLSLGGVLSLLPAARVSAAADF